MFWCIRKQFPSAFHFVWRHSPDKVKLVVATLWSFSVRQTILLLHLAQTKISKFEYRTLASNRTFKPFYGAKAIKKVYLSNFGIPLVREVWVPIVPANILKPFRCHITEVTILKSDTKHKSLNMESVTGWNIICH